MANKLKKRCLKPLVIMEIQINTTMRYHCVLVKCLKHQSWQSKYQQKCKNACSYITRVYNGTTILNNNLAI